MFCDVMYCIVSHGLLLYCTVCIVMFCDVLYCIVSHGLLLYFVVMSFIVLKFIFGNKVILWCVVLYHAVSLGI